MNLAKLFKLPKKLGDSMLISLINNMVDYLRNYDSAIKVDDNRYIHLKTDDLYLETNHDDDFDIYTVKNLYIGTREGSDFTISSDNMLSLYADNSISIQSDDVINLISNSTMNLTTGDERDINLTSDGGITLYTNNGFGINLYSDGYIELSSDNEENIILTSDAGITLATGNEYEINLISNGSIVLQSENDNVIKLKAGGGDYDRELILNSSGNGLNYKQDDNIYFQIDEYGNVMALDDEENLINISHFIPTKSEINIDVVPNISGQRNITMNITTVFGTQSKQITNSTQVITINYNTQNPYVIISFTGDGLNYSDSGKAIFYKGDGYTLEMDINKSLIIPNITSITRITIEEPYCYTADTLITLADGSTKQVKDITYDDELKVWNFDEGKDDVAKPLWIKRTEHAKSYQLVTLSDGNTIKLCGSDGKYHCMFDVTEQKFNHAVDCIGHEVYTENGIATVVSIEEVKEKVDHYNIVTNYHMNLYANHILTSTEKNNIYPIADMKFVKNDRKIVPYEEFEKAHISREYYDGWRAGEWNEPLKDVITHLRRRKMYAKPQKRVKDGLRTDYFG